MMRGVPLHAYYMQFGQYTNLMGSGRPPWAAGECNIVQRDGNYLDEKEIMLHISNYTLKQIDIFPCNGKRFLNISRY